MKSEPVLKSEPVMNSQSAPTDTAARPEINVVAAMLALVSCQIGLHATMTGMRVGIPLLALQQNYSKFSLGLVVASFAIIPALLALEFGRFTDRRGYHGPVYLAASLSLVGSLVLVISHELWVLLMAASCCGAGSGFGMIAIQRTASRLTDSAAERVKIFSWIALAPALGGLIGPLLVGSLIDNFGFTQAFLLLAVFPVLALISAMFVPHEAVQLQSKAAQARRESALGLLNIVSLRRILLINLAVVASWDAHGFALPILGHAREFSATAIGSVFAAYSAATLLVRVLMPFISAHLPQRYLLVYALAGMAAVFALYPLLPAVWMLMLAAAVFGIVMGMINPTLMGFLHDSAPVARQGEVLALRSMFNQMSMTALPLVYGLVGLISGAEIMFWIMAAALLAAAWQARYLVAEPPASSAPRG